MRLLRLVGPGEDGTSLIVEAVDTGSLEGERFTLSLDDRLRTMASTQPARQHEAPAASSGPAPTPREIQVRVRAGETAEAVADEAGIPLERVMRFAYPVLQERVRVTDEARRARARRGGDGLLVPFGELIDSRLARHGVDPASVRWDAYRREDGGWTVTSEFSSHERGVLAKFSFALLNRTVSALDDIAADLLSDRPVQALLAPPAPEPVADPADAEWAPDWDSAAPPRLTAVPNPRPAEAPRPQEASAAVRPPSRRQKAHTRPVPINAEDELFDQNAFDQQPWHEPPLPFEVGAGGRGGSPSTSSSPRHRDQRPTGGATSDAVKLAQPDIAEASVAEPDVEALFQPAGSSPAHTEPATSSPTSSDPATSPVDAATASAPPAAADSTTGADAVSTGAGDPQNKRGRRPGEKPRMPSWDDILLGVRHKSD
ncbi:MAG: hypothetical protein QOI26_1148 [Pseudonocardiales bacterium]|nr:hypothetical protein [Pseudonocardiales bacterium]